MDALEAAVNDYFDQTSEFRARSEQAVKDHDAETWKRLVEQAVVDAYLAGATVGSLVRSNHWVLSSRSTIVRILKRHNVYDSDRFARN